MSPQGSPRGPRSTQRRTPRYRCERLGIIGLVGEQHYVDGALKLAQFVHVIGRTDRGKVVRGKSPDVCRPSRRTGLQAYDRPTGQRSLTSGISVKVRRWRCESSADQSFAAQSPKCHTAVHFEEGRRTIKRAREKLHDRLGGSLTSDVLGCVGSHQNNVTADELTDIVRGRGHGFWVVVRLRVPL